MNFQDGKSSFAYLMPTLTLPDVSGSELAQEGHTETFSCDIRFAAKFLFRRLLSLPQDVATRFVVFRDLSR